MSERKTVSLENHPCFNQSACHDHARIHLPVAPKCNVQCGFCNRKYDCVNESRPGVTSSVLSPAQALYYLQESMKKRFFDVVGIAGPGDPFANPEQTMETLRLVHEAYPEVMLCTATNGLNIRPYINELAELGVTHVTLTINGVDPEIAGSVYRWMRPGKKVVRGRAAGEVLIKEQLHAIKELKANGILVKINSIIIPGVNDFHIPEIAKVVGELGADTMNCLPLIPVKGTDFGTLSEPDAGSVFELRAKCREHLPQMAHCRRCRADAAGLLEEAMGEGTTTLLQQAADLPLNPFEKRPCVAIGTREGVLVNQHLGHAEVMKIYKETESGYVFLEDRTMPKPGGGDERWLAIASLLKDCSDVLVSGIGSRPNEVLTETGIKVQLVEGLIDNALLGIKKGESLAHMAVRTKGCSGNAVGCA